MRKTLLIVAAVLIPLGAIGIGLASRLMTPPASAAGDLAAPGSTSSATTGPARPAGGSAAGPASASSGQGVAIQFSDKPVVVPAFSLTDFDGKPMTPEGWRGKVVLVNCWATWCGYCVKEMPELIALQERYRDQLIIVGLSTDTIPVADVKAFAKQAHLNYPVAIAGPDVQAAFGGISGLPSTFVVNPQGGIVQRHVGLLDPVLTEQEVRVLANAAYATEIPGVDLSTLAPRQKADVLRRLNTAKCTCGCGLTVAQCRINDPTCTTSLPIAQKIAAGK